MNRIVSASRAALPRGDALVAKRIYGPFIQQAQWKMKMRSGMLGKFVSAFLLSLTLAAGQLVWAQSQTTGEITGVVTDPSGAVVANASVTLKSNEKGFTQTATTNAVGVYRFALLNPGSYTVKASASGFQQVSREVSVTVGATVAADFKMSLGNASTIIEVAGQAPVVQAENGDTGATFNQLAVANVPNPGSDLTYVAQTAPGSVMNTGSGYGNFSSYGISATSNLFTLNGMYQNDPFLNLNNSGATNLLLGANEVQEVNVVTNGYSGQYGGFAGANVNYITKSGSNRFHGNSIYEWNGRAVNANSWFNKQGEINQGEPNKPQFVNANQYAASFGGPIVKDKAFFFINYEGLRVIIPTSTAVLVPSPQFQAATIANLNSLGLQNSVPFYNQMFALYNATPGIANAVTTGDPSQTSDTTGCQGNTFPGGIGGPGGLPCVYSLRSAVGNLTHEYQLAGRFDFNLTQNDKLFVRAWEDKGLQATATDPINPLFNSQSTQPQYQGQISETHTFGTKAVNQFILSSSYYSAIFQPANLSKTLATFPTTLLMNDGSFTTLGGLDYIWPQGRNITQYQISDDFSYSLTPNHNLKFGVNFNRYDISDHDYGLFTSGLLIPFGISDFFNGGSTGDELLQNFATSLNQPIKTYGLGFYLEDDWRATSNLKLTLALRGDRGSNPTCNTKCFARLTGPFDSISHDVNTPYSTSILVNQSHALPSFTGVALEPKLGFAWAPFGKKNMVLRGGIGLFSDAFPGVVADNQSSNMPVLNPFTVLFQNLAPTETNGGNIFATAAASNQALLTGFAANETLAQIEASDPNFAPPNFNNAPALKTPIYQKWTLEYQYGFSDNTSVTLSYDGNHGTHEPAFLNGVNGFCPPTDASGNPVCPNGFSGLPSVIPDQRFGTVSEARTIAVSNYHGLTVAGVHRFSKGLQFQLNYTWSHALDEISNGGVLPFILATNTSLLSPVDNNNLKKYNYGNADYDVRQYFSANYLYEIPYGWGPKALLKGWRLSGTLFARTGLPFTVTDSAATSILNSNFYGGTAYANFLGGSQPSCSTPSKNCLNSSDFSTLTAVDPVTQVTFMAATGFGTQRRNQFRGPKYFDTDMTLMKNTKIGERVELGIGAQFFNLLNHPNFDQPHADVSGAKFGVIDNTVNPPTSILGSFLGGDASPRLVQLTARITF